MFVATLPKTSFQEYQEMRANPTSQMKVQVGFFGITSKFYVFRPWRVWFTWGQVKSVINELSDWLERQKGSDHASAVQRVGLAYEMLDRDPIAALELMIRLSGFRMDMSLLRL